MPDDHLFGATLGNGDDRSLAAVESLIRGGDRREHVVLEVPAEGCAVNAGGRGVRLFGMSREDVAADPLSREPEAVRPVLEVASEGVGSSSLPSGS